MFCYNYDHIVLHIIVFNNLFKLFRPTFHQRYGIKSQDCELKKIISSHAHMDRRPWIKIFQTQGLECNLLLNCSRLVKALSCFRITTS